MPRNKRFTCDQPGCDKVATRVLRYFVDGPQSVSLDARSEQFCDEHAETEMLLLQSPGMFAQTMPGGADVECTVSELTNLSIEDHCCWERTKDGRVAVRVGSNVDPELWGYRPESRGTTFIEPPRRRK